MPINVRTSPSGPLIETSETTDDITNVSNLSGTTLTDALDTIVGMTFLREIRILVAGAGTHVCGTDATHARIRGTGGGGAGGGANAALAQGSAGGAATAGGTFEKLLTLSAGQSIPYSVGAGGIGVVGTTGGNGAPTTATYDSVTYTANGGVGSVSSTSGITLQLIGCLAGGTASNGDVNITGGCGTLAVRESATSGAGGNGGNSADAPGGVGASSPISGNLSADGGAGQLGSGGGGAVNFNNSPAAGNTGGNGGTGYLYIQEFAELP